MPSLPRTQGERAGRAGASADTAGLAAGAEAGTNGDVAPSDPGVAPTDRWITTGSRIVGAAAIALGVCLAANSWIFAGEPLSAETDVVGFPTVENLNVEHYGQMFLLAVVVFPVVGVLSYLLIGRAPWVFTRIGSSRLIEACGIVGRLALPGAALGLEQAVATQATGVEILAPLALGVVAYVLAALVASVLLTWWRPVRSFPTRLATANLLLTPAPVLGLGLVSTNVVMSVVETGEVDHHPFLPWPVAAVAALAILISVVWRVRRAGTTSGSLAALRALEFDTVALVAGSVLVFLLRARLPGALGGFDAFHEGEGLATATLLRDGAFPWRDALFIHGPLYDGLWPLVGLSVFGDTRWGMDAGTHMLVLPLYYVLVWLLLVRTVGRNWVVLGGYLLVMAAGEEFFGGTLLAGSTRLAMLPLVVLLLAHVIRARSRPSSFGLGAAMLLSFVLTPEFAFAIVAVAATLIGFEAVTGRSEPWHRRFPATLWCAAGGITAAVVVSVWLVGNDALDDFIFYFRTFAPDHDLTGGFVVTAENGVNYVFAALLPFALALVAGAYLVWRLTSGRRLHPADWAIASLALLGLVYYPKFLARPDGHVFANVAIGLPVLAYAVARILAPADRDVARSARGRSPRHLVSALVLGALCLTAFAPAARAFVDVPAQFQRETPSPAGPGRLGYLAPGAIQPHLLDDLHAVVEAVGPDAQVFDFTNQPGVVHYLMGLPSPTRYPHVSMAIREPNQADLIDQLQADPPELAVYWSTTYGLPVWDQINNFVRHYDVSQWLLENYEPLALVQGNTFLIRRDLDKPDLGALTSQLNEAPMTDDLYFRLPECRWGTAPAFLDDDTQVATGGATLSATPLDRTASFTGRVGPVDGLPASRVLAVSPSGLVLDEGAAVQADGQPGFALTVPLAPGERPEDVQIVAVGESPASAAAEANLAVAVGAEPAPAPGTELLYSAGRSARVTVGRTTGAIDGIGVTWFGPNEHVQRLDLPAGATSHADWIELTTGDAPAEASYSLMDIFTAGPGRTIGFRTTDQPVDRYLVQAASCPQWQGMTGRTLYLYSDSSQPVTMTLQRSIEPPG